MTKFLVRRFFYGIAVVILVTLFVFILSRASGDPRTVFLNEYTTQEQWDEWGRQWGLDKPVIVQYFLWLGRAATGNLGQSLRESRPVLDVILERVPATVQLAAGAFAFAILLGLPFGVLSAVWRGSWLDYFGRTVAFVRPSPPAVLVRDYVDPGICGTTRVAAYEPAGGARSLHSPVHHTRLAHRFRPVATCAVRHAGGARLRVRKNGQG